MSVHPLSQLAPVAALVSLRGVTMADVLDRLAALTDLDKGRRAGLMSAVRTFCRGLGKAPIDLSGEPQAVRAGLARLTPGVLGLNQPSFNNFRSLLGKALTAAGIDTIGVRNRAPWSSAWEPLVRRLVGKTMQWSLTRPLRLLSEAGIEPQQVDQGVADELGRALEARQVLRQPRLAFVNFVREWNRARAAVPGWPQVELRVDDRRNRYMLGRDVFQPSLCREIDDRLRAVSTFSLTRRRPPLRPRTVAGHRLRLWELASAAVHAGVPVGELSSLRTLVDASVVERALEWLAVRFGGKPAPHLGDIARLAYSIARDLTDATEGDRRQVEECNLRELKRFCQNLKPAPIGLAPKNRVLLKRFKDPDLLARFVTMPQHVFQKIIVKNDLTPIDAIRARVALAIEILLHAPLRIQNLHALDLGVHYKAYGQGPKARVVLEFTAAEVKNSVDLSYPLPAPAAGMVAVFRERLRPLLADPGNPYLFAGRAQRPMQAEHLSKQIAKMTFDVVGIRVTAHQFRHICALIYLLQHPGDYETVRQFLGHKKVETTIRFYAGMEGEAAIQLWDDTLAKVRQAAIERLATSRRRQRQD
jgi:integrase